MITYNLRNSAQNERKLFRKGVLGVQLGAQFALLAL